MKKLILFFCFFSTILNAQETDVIKEYYNNIASAYSNLSADDMMRNYSDRAVIFRSNRNNFIQIFSDHDEVMKYYNDEFSLLTKEKKKMVCTIKISETRRRDNQIFVSGFQNLETTNESGILNNDTGAFSHAWFFENNEWKLQSDAVIPVPEEEFQKGVTRY